MKTTTMRFCVRCILCALAAAFLGQILLPSVSLGSTGSGSIQAGAGLVRQQLADGALKKTSNSPLSVYAMQPGDVFCDVLVKAGLTRKDALNIAKKANKVFRLNRMRPGSELEFYFTADGACLKEIDYKVSGSKRVVLYNGRVISLARVKPGAVSSADVRPGPKRQAVKAHQSSQRPVVADKKISRAPQSTLNKRAATGTNRPLKSGAASVRTPAGRNAPDPVPAKADAMKTASAYNCGLPETVGISPRTPYEMLASGLVVMPALPSWNKGAAKATDQEELTDIEDGRAALNAHRQGPAARKGAATVKKARLKKHTERMAKKDEPPFLSAPLTYRRVSSGFSYSRISPFTNEPQPHLGVDYSAPSGTPVYSIGAGRVNFIGWDGGYGKTIRIMHPNGYITHYAHLSRFSRNIMQGKRVRKGEIIGYVGMTGQSTGPHLDFRVTHLGAFINPATMEYSTRKAASKKSAGKSHRVPRG